MKPDNDNAPRSLAPTPVPTATALDVLTSKLRSVRDWALLPLRPGIEMPTDVAVRQFIRELGPGKVHRSALIWNTYFEMRAERGWPDLPLPTLARHLMLLGCVRHRRRAENGTDVTMIALPHEPTRTKSAAKAS